MGDNDKPKITHTYKQKQTNNKKEEQTYDNEVWYYTKQISQHREDIFDRFVNQTDRYTVYYTPS